MAKAGRKSTYKPVYSGKRLEQYLEMCTDEEVKQVVQENQEKGYAMYKSKIKVNLPTIVGYAAHLGVTEPTVHNWAKNYPEFRVALDKIKVAQQQRLIERGLDGSYNSTIAKLILSANHGMREKSDLTTAGEPLKSFNDDQVNRIAQRIARRSSGDGNSSSTEKSD